MIPDEAIDAAAKAWLARVNQPGSWTLDDNLRVAIEAAIPFLSEAARQPQRTSPTDWPDLPKASR